MKTPGRSEPCPCGSGKKFKRCHGRHTPPPPEFVAPLTYLEGETPTWLRNLVHDAICEVFDDPRTAMIGPHGRRCVRGELCAAVAMTVVWVLREYGIASRFVCGSAQWAGYPIGFLWKGEAEYHAWVETQYREFVDLACDSLRVRSDTPAEFRGFRSPSSWWGRPELKRGCKYEEVPGGWQQISVNPIGDPGFLKIAQRVLQYVQANEQHYREQAAQKANSQAAGQ